jgi:hypothetical protein
MMNLNLKFYTVVRKAMKYIHNFFEIFLRLLLVGLHGFARTASFAPDMLPQNIGAKENYCPLRPCKYVNVKRLCVT